MRWLILIAVLIIVVVVLARRRRQQPAAPVGNRSLPVDQSFHAVEIEPRPGARGCQAVEQQSGERYLAGEAPKLPLPGCSIPNRCRCHYVHHDDRRGEPRRRADLGLPDPIISGGDEQREGRDRRHG